VLSDFTEISRINDGATILRLKDQVFMLESRLQELEETLRQTIHTVNLEEAENNIQILNHQ
jgi:hypothetical protein